MTIKNLDLSPDEKLVQSLEDKQAQAKSQTAENLSSREPNSAKTDFDKAVNSSTNQQVNQSTDPSIDQSTNQSTKQLTGPVVDRPVAFYLPKIVDKKIDEAVLYYQENHRRKIDRSAVVSALLGDPNMWTHEALDTLADKVIDQLTSRVTNRLMG